jgi:hypothetical protein
MSEYKRQPAASAQRTMDNVLVCRLALERCQQHLAHLHAILHLCLPEQAFDEDMVAVAGMRKIISSMAQELTYSVDTLVMCD